MPIIPPPPQTRAEVLNQITQCGAMSYAEWVAFLDSVVFILDGTGGSPVNAAIKTPVIITDGNQVAINWLTDLVPGSTSTYFQKHGSYVHITEENQDDNGKWTPNGTPSYSFNAAKTILTLSPQTINTNFLII